MSPISHTPPKQPILTGLMLRGLVVTLAKHEAMVEGTTLADDPQEQEDLTERVENILRRLLEP